MSLRVWLPLNGKLNNQGISAYQVAEVDTTIDNSGKIGQCYSFNGTSSRITISNFSIGNIWSYGAWIYAPTSSRSWEGAIILNTNGGDADMQLGFYTYPTGSRIQSTANGQYNSSISMTYGQWNHLFATFDGSNLKTYINGILVNTKAITNTQLTRTNLTIGARCRGSSYDCFFSGKINDVRIYDHCLSAAEVKEIAQGLILHYKLDGVCGGTNRNLLRGSATIGNTSAGIYGWVSNGTASNIEKLDGEIIHYSYNLSNSKNIPSITTNTAIACEFGKSYTYTMELKLDREIVLGGSTPMHYWIGARNTNVITNTSCNGNLTGITTTWVQNHNSERIPANTWVKIITTFTFPAAASNSDYPYPAIRCFVYGSSLTEAYTGVVNVWMRHCKIEEGRKSTPWVQAIEDMGINNTIVEDSSGYNHNLTLTGNLLNDNTTPRYSTSMAFNGATVATAPSTGADIRTISCWVKTTKNKSTSQIFVADSGSNMCVSFYSGTIIGVFGTTRSTGSKCTLGSSYKENDWNHIVVVKTSDDGMRDIWCNGEKLTPAANDYWSAAAGIWLGARNASLGNPLYGSLSDVRFYCTPLLDTDIKQLYNVSMKIDKSQQIHAFDTDEQLFNIMYKPNFAIGAQIWQDGLNRYTQSNCQVNLTNDGVYIYRPANLNQTDNGNTMYGGLKIVNSTVDNIHVYDSSIDNIFNLQKGHTYIWVFHVKGNTTNAPRFQINNNMGWDGGGLSPAPSDVIIKNISGNFNGETEVWYKFTINDDIVKTCTSAYSSFIANNQYLSYKHFGWNWSYATTGNGTNIYITNIRLYDITNMPIGKLTKSGIIKFSSIFEVNSTIHLTKNEDLILNQFIER